METDQQKEEEISSKKQKITQIEQPEFVVDKVKFTISLQHTNHKGQSTIVAAERSKETDGRMPFSSNMHKFQGKESFVCIESCYKETSCLMSNVHGIESFGECNTTTSNTKAKISLIGVRRQKNGRYGAVITDTIRHKQVWLGTFDTVEEASQVYLNKKLDLENEKLNQQGNKENRPEENCDQIQQPESPIVQCLFVANDRTSDTASVSRINSHETTHIVEVHKNKMSGEETPCVMASVHGIESSDECNTSTSNPKANISLIGVRGQKNGRYGAVITDTIRHKQVWLGTFDTVEEASQAYFNKKLELENEKLNRQGNKENRPEENCDQIQQPESPIVQCLSVTNDRTLDTASVSRINSHETTHIVEGHKNKMSGEEPESSKETACVMASVRGIESSDEWNTSTSNPKANISLIGVRRQKNGRYGAVITDTSRHKQVWLGTFDTVGEASLAYFNKKLELENEKLNQQGNKESKSKENLDQIQQPESPIVQCLSVANDQIQQPESPSVQCLSVANDQTLDTASVSRINSHETTHTVEVHKNKMSGEETESSKETPCVMASAHGTESSDECNTSTSNPKANINLIGVRRQKNGRYGAVITDTTRHKQVWLGTFDTVEEASQAYLSKKSELENEKLNKQGNKENRPEENCDQIQHSESSVVLASLSVADVQTLDTAIVDMRNDRIDFRKTTHIVGVHKSNTSEKEPESSKETPCLMANVHGTESNNECNTRTSSLPTDKRSLLGIRRQKNGRYGAVITDQIRHKQVWLGTFDTVEEASQAYFSKKTEFEKLSQQGNKDTKPEENCDQIQQPESPVVLASLSVANDQTSDTASVGRRNGGIDSHEKKTHIVEVHKNNMSGKEHESSKETPCLIASARGTESSAECNTSTSNPKAKMGLTGVRRQKNGRYGAVIRDTVRHKKVWLGTFDTVEEASQAYLSKKSELKKLGQQSNKENKPKKSCDQVQQPESPVMASLSGANHDQTSNTAQVRTNKSIDSHKTTTHFFRVHKRKDSGKYTTEIRNPITKKRIWLGTFVTAEEASQAYQYKNIEFQKLVDAKRQCGNEQTHSKQDGKSEKLVNIKQGHENVNCELESAGGSEIDVQISNSSNGGTEQRIDSHEIGTGEEAFYAYLSKKFNLQISKNVELQSDMPTDSSAGEEKQEGQEDDEDLWMGEWVQLPGNRAVKFSLKLGLPIIDNYGSLLGEFSTLDDLSICKTEDGNET